MDDSLQDITISHSFITVFTYLFWLYYIAMLREQGNAQSLPYIEVILLYIAGHVVE